MFPNRRALVFFRKYLIEFVKQSGQPLLEPELYTMNDFFYRITGSSPSGQVALLLELYDCYRELNPAHESLDEFIFWGGVLLSDFNDIDKYLVGRRRCSPTWPSSARCRTATNIWMNASLPRSGSSSRISGRAAATRTSSARYGTSCCRSTVRSTGGCAQGTLL